MKFKTVRHIDDIRPFVKNKKEIFFTTHENGVTICCYAYKDASTFDTLESLECRGIAFDAKGLVVSRPLHKFFNVNESVETQTASLLKKNIIAYMEKIDGSMLSTCKVGNEIVLRSKASFSSDVAVWGTAFMNERKNFKDFCEEVSLLGLTASFEYMDPRQPIVIASKNQSLTLLHVRDNITGTYVMLDKNHAVWNLIKHHKIPVAPVFSLSFEEMLENAKTATHTEGYVVQFDDGDMVKLKTEWYLLRHRAISFLRERDVAVLALNEGLDDTKSILREMGADMKRVEEIETRVKNTLLSLEDEIAQVCKADGDLNRKAFVEKHQKNPLFSLMIKKMDNRNYSLKEYFEKKILRRDFGLSVIVTQLKNEEINEPAKYKKK